MPEVDMPEVDMMASNEMQAWLRQLRAEDQRVGVRIRYLLGVLAVGMGVLIVVLWGVYRSTVGGYAVIDGIEIRQHPLQQGRLQIKFRVLTGGKVHCRRTSGDSETELVDYFSGPCEVDRPWSWPYQPGKPLRLTLWYRRGLFRQTHTVSFATLDQADIVVLMDTTGSMGPSIKQLKAKCAAFSEQLDHQALKHRFALIGFGDAKRPPWIDQHGFASDVEQFVGWVDRVGRFDGGDLPESALDALERALQLPLQQQALRRFYLVTDAEYHEPSQSGATAEQLAARLEQQGVLLSVFSKPEFRAKYEKLTGESGMFREIESFGEVLSRGRVLED